MNGNQIRRVAALIVCIGLTVILIGVAIWGDRNAHSGSSHTGNVTGTGAAQVPSSLPTQVSPLLFGTNLSLFDRNDQVLNSSTTRNLLQQMHSRIIRMPVRSNLSEATEIAAAQVIKNLGAIPLVALHGAVDANVLADDTRIISDMNRIFGNSTVYYEYGNEEDLLGIDVARYTASWNAIVPQLKRIATQGQFVGPVNYQYDRAYLTSFLRNASPRPDEVSWHEYTCDDSWSNDICISHIAHWTNHISDARDAMISAIGSTLPIMITEWNYAPNAVPNDGKNNNPSFMTTWTTRALQTLAANRIFASMQYSCTNTAISLIASAGTLTTQGQIFLSQYQQMIVNGKQPPAISGSLQPVSTTGQSNGSLNPIATVPLSSSSSFSFEDGETDGWSSRSSEISSVQNTTNLALDGKHSLQVTLSNVSSSDFPYVAVGRSNLANYPQAGQTLKAYVYLPSNSVSLMAKIFIMDNNYHWFSSALLPLIPGVWSRLSYTLPSSISGQPRLLGIQFNNASTMPITTEVYIDAISWSS